MVVQSFFDDTEVIPSSPYIKNSPFLLWGSCTNPWGMEFGLRPAQQHTSPKHSNDDKKQGENSFQ